MNVKRAMILATMMVASAALTAPAVSHAKVFGAVEGVPLEPGDKVTGISTNLRMTTAVGTFECESLVQHGEVVVNGPDHVVGEATGEITTTGCVLNFGVGKFPITVTDATTFGESTANTWGTGVVPVTFTAHVYSNAGHTELVMTCIFHGNIHGQGVISGGSFGDIGPSTLTGTGQGCPSSGVVHGTLTGQAADGTPIEGFYVETE